jgi:RNA polymerase sigma-70 factor (ECF subfamily)
MDYASDNSSLLKSLQMVRVPDTELSPEHEAVAEIVQRALTGDSLAFEQLIARYERRVMTVSLRILGTREDAHDAAQEVFLRVFKYLHRLDPRKPIEPWLMRITINVCRDIGRKRKHHQSSCPDFTEVDSIAMARSAQSCQDPHEGLAEQQQRNLVRQALDCLSEGERIAIVLRDVEGLPTSEVAEILQAPEATVRSRISRGRLKLKEAVDRLSRRTL